MKRILFIAPSSYPLYGAESIVNLKLLSALTKSGQFEIDLISKKNKHSEYKGNSLEDLGISLKDLHIVEVDNTINLKTLWGHFLSLFYFGVVFKGSHWAYYAMRVAKTLCKENKYDYVVTKNSPSLLVGYYLKKKYGLKWVATWNDPYPDNLYPEIYADFMNAKEDWASRRQIKMLRKFVDVHIFPNDRLRNHLLKFYNVSIDKTLVIPHVVLDKDVNNNAINDGILRIVHSGNIAYPRDPESFLAGLRLFLDKNPEASIKVDVIGVMDSSFNGKLERYGLTGIVSGIPPLSYLDSLKFLLDYNICLIVEANVPEGIFLPTKVSDFMQEHMPIMAVSPQVGVLNDLYKESYIGYFADVCDPNTVEKALERLYSDFSNKSIKSSEVPDSYTEKEIVKQYLQL